MLFELVYTVGGDVAGQFPDRHSALEKARQLLGVPIIYERTVPNEDFAGAISSVGLYMSKAQRDAGSPGLILYTYEDEDEQDSGYTSNARATVVDPIAAHELSLYIENEYALIGAPNSIGKNIDAGLRRKVASGKYDPALAPKAWQYLIEEGAKRYKKELGSGDFVFSAATRRQVAEEFARAWEQENGVPMRANGRVRPGMEPYADWSYEDFYNDLIDDGQTPRDARLQATRYSHQVGRLDFLPPRNIPKGWTLHQSPILRRRDAKPAFVGHKGSKYMVFGLDGKPLSPELRRIRGLIEWRDANGWADT